jgi:hypothetical protein
MHNQSYIYRVATAQTPLSLIVHLVGCFIEYLKMHGTTNPKSKYRSWSP